MAIFSDELNHASIIDGARLALRSGSSSGSSSSGSGSAGGGGGVSLHVYRHNDLNHLEVRGGGGRWPCTCVPGVGDTVCMRACLAMSPRVDDSLLGMGKQAPVWDLRSIRWAWAYMPLTPPAHTHRHYCFPLSHVLSHVKEHQHQHHPPPHIAGFPGKTHRPRGKG